MNKKHFMKNFLIGTICVTFMIPMVGSAIVGGSVLRSQPTGDAQVIQPISQEIEGHWASRYAQYVKDQFGIVDLMTNNDFDDAIELEVLRSLSEQIFDVELSDLDATTREAVVANFTEVWAEKTGRDVNEIVIPMILVYPDTEEIDQQYTQQVMIGYHHGIAKGRDTGLFAPKDLVTYGEAVTLIANLDEAIKSDTIDNGEEKMEHSFETNVDVTVNETHVIFDMTLKNISDVAQEIQFSSGQQYEVVIMDENQEEIYRFSDGRFFTMALIMEQIQPDETIQWQLEWDRMDKEDQLVEEGSFQVVVEILATMEDQRLDLVETLVIEL